MSNLISFTHIECMLEQKLIQTKCYSLQSLPRMVLNLKQDWAVKLYFFPLPTSVPTLKNIIRGVFSDPKMHFGLFQIDFYIWWHSSRWIKFTHSCMDLWKASIELGIMHGMAQGIFGWVYTEFKKSSVRYIIL